MLRRKKIREKKGEVERSGWQRRAVLRKALAAAAAVAVTAAAIIVIPTVAQANSSGAGQEKVVDSEQVQTVEDVYLENLAGVPGHMEEVVLNVRSDEPATYEFNGSLALSDTARRKGDSEEIAEKVKANMDIYTYAAAEEDIPWQFLAAIHHNEADFGTGRSLSNGSSLNHISKKAKSGWRDDGDGRGRYYWNVDKVRVYSDPREDAVEAARHLKAMARSYYGVDMTDPNLSMEEAMKGFIAYARGDMYRNAGASWEESPYIMNFADENHRWMKWQLADSYYKGDRINGLAGAKYSKLGVFGTLLFLGWEGAN